MPAKTMIGVDVGSTSIRAVEANLGDRPIITNFGHAPLPAGAVVGGVVKDDRAVTEALRQLWSTQKFTTKTVVLAATHQQIVVRPVEISNLPPKELRQALPFQVRDVLPIPVENAVLDFYPLEQSPGGETVRGLLIAAPKEAVSNTVRAVERAGLKVERVDLACFAALRSAAHLAQDTEAVVDIGANATSIIVHRDGVPELVRTIPRGGSEVTRAVSTRLGMPLAEAEMLKCRVGLVRGEGPDSADVVAEALRPLVSEIRSSLNYHANAHPEGRVQRLALVGGSALLPGLANRLTDELNVTAFLSDPLLHVDDTRSGGRHDALVRFRSSAAVAIGLTLGIAS